jgi:hypothetical protein
MNKHGYFIIPSIVAATLLFGSRSAAAPAIDDLLNNDGNDPTDPVNRFDRRTQVTTLPDLTRSGRVFDDLRSASETLHTDMAFFSKAHQLQMRVDLPLTESNVPTTQNCDGHTQFGFGDTLLQGLYSHPFDARWAAAVGGGRFCRRQPIQPSARASGKSDRGLTCALPSRRSALAAMRA